MAKITVRFNESGTITVALKDQDADGKRSVRIEVAASRSDLSRAVNALFAPAVP